MAAKKWTEAEVLDLYIETVGNPLNIDVDKDSEIILFKELAKVDGLDEYLRATMGEDIKRAFQSQTDVERAIIKGGYARTMYIRAMLKKVRENKEIMDFKGKRTETVAHT